LQRLAEIFASVDPLMQTPRSLACHLLLVRAANQSVSEEEDYMNIIGWILFGLVVGIVGKLLMPGRDPGGFILTILLGVAGALVGGFVGQSLGFYQEGEPAGFLMAVVGSIVLLLLYRLFVGRRDRI
jgi:uncharacterized membrane protein YeaQ/YmgE (transglycosylase-associated protein family)